MNRKKALIAIALATLVIGVFVAANVRPESLIGGNAVVTPLSGCAHCTGYGCPGGSCNCAQAVPCSCGGQGCQGLCTSLKCPFGSNPCGGTKSCFSGGCKGAFCPTGPPACGNVNLCKCSSCPKGSCG